MTGHDATGSERQPAICGNVVLIVSTDGTVHSVLETPRSADGQDLPASRLASIDTIWPDDVVLKLQSGISRVARGRESFRDVIDNCEFLFVPQGRDRALIVVHDLTSRSLKLSDSHDLAYKDKVTGLPNREFLLGELKKVAQMQQLREGRAAMICIHIDQFDDHGYSLSSLQQDEIMRELAIRLRKQLRGTNDVSDDDLERMSIVARTDFRQFSVVLPSIECGEDAEAVVSRLISSLMRPVSVGARTISATIFGGVSLFPQDGTDAETLFDNAIAALEDARNCQSDPFKLHSGTVRLRALQRQDLEIELRSALEREDYSLSFLPIVNASGYRPVTIEALLRWPETILGTHSTRKVVAIAERTGLIIPIGEWVLRHAAEHLKRWREAGHEELRVAINLSAQEFCRGDLASRVARILDDVSIGADAIDFEIREHMLLRDAMAGFSSCRTIKALGARLVVDDFGTGTCSLEHLSQSPVDAIKIDPAFTYNMEASDRFRAASDAAIALAAKLGVDVVAEGVETAGQAEMLAGMGCGYLQGFYFAQPLRADKVIEYLESTEESSRNAGASR